MNVRISRCILFSVALLLAGLTGAWGETLQDVLEAGQKKYEQSDFKGALTLWKRGLAKARQEKDSIHEIDLLTRIGNTYYHQGDYPQAQLHFEQVLAILRELKDRKGEIEILAILDLDRTLKAKVLLALGGVYLAQGDLPQARRHLEQALAIFRELKNRQLESRLLVDLGALCKVQGDLSQARRYYEQALAIFRELKNPDMEGVVLELLDTVNRPDTGEGTGPSGADGETWQDVLEAGQKKYGQSDFKGAQAIWERGLVQARQEKNRFAEGSFLSFLGALCKAQSELPQARRHLEQALAIFRELKDSDMEGVVLELLDAVNRPDTGEGTGPSGADGETWQDDLKAGEEKLFKQSDWQGALTLWKRGLAQANQEKNRRAVGNFLTRLGFAYRAQGDLPQAQLHFEQALAIARELDNRSEESTALVGLGSLYMTQGDLLQARRHYEQALAIFQELKDRESEGKVLNILGALNQAHTGDLTRMVRETLQDVLNAGWKKYDQSDFQGALALWKLGLEQARQKGNQQDVGVFSYVLGVVYQALGDLPQAQLHFEQALAIVRELKDLAGEGKALHRLGEVYRAQGDFPQARRHLEQALAIFQELKDLAGEGEVLGILGALNQAHAGEGASLSGAGRESWQDVFEAGQKKFKQSDFKGAQAIWEQGLALARQENDRRAEGGFLTSISLVYDVQGDLPQARRHLEQALAIFQELPDREWEGKALLRLGEIYGGQGDLPQARRHLEQALVIFRELKDRKLEGEALRNLGVVYIIFGHSQARRHLEQALVIFQELKDRKLEGEALHSLGAVYRSMFLDYPQARRHYEQALAIARELKDRKLEGRDLSSLGAVYQSMGDYPQARRHYEQALAIAQELKDLAGEGEALRNLGVVYQDLGDFPQARRHIEQALATFRGVGVPILMEHAESGIGDVYLAQGQLQEALAFYQRLNDQTGLGRYYLRVSNYDKARDAFTRYLKTAEEKRNASLLLVVYIGSGLAHEGLKNYVQAKTYYQKAVDFIERQREGLNEAERRYFFAAKVGDFSRLEPYEGLMRVSSQLKDPAMAFHWAEHTKARLLLDAVARRYRDTLPGLPDTDLAHQEAELDQQFVSTYKQLDLAFQDNNAERRQALEQELPGLKQKQQALIARLRQQYPAYAVIRYPQPLRLEELTLDPHEALIEYEVTDSVTYAWLIKGNQIRKTLTVPLGRAALTEQVKRYRGFFDIRSTAQLNQFDPRLGQQLYNLLFKDFAPLLDKNDRIILVPDEILSILPFEALVVEAPAQLKRVQGKPGRGPTWPGVRYLGERYALRYAQSASALQQGQHLPGTAPAAGKTLLVVADPVFDEQDVRVQQARRSPQPLQVAQRSDDQRKQMEAMEQYGQISFPRLNRTGDLPGEFQRLYGQNAVEVITGLEVTKENVRGRLTQPQRYAVLATHGILDSHLPYVQEPALVLTQVKPAVAGDTGPAAASDDPLLGFLTLTDVMGLKIPASLVALTACSTGLGRELTGEGVMNMGRAFQYAGARHVLMSLWSVSEVTTVQLTERFFARLKDGQELLDAVRGARADLRQAGYDHPYFWAPFVLVGR